MKFVLVHLYVVYIIRAIIPFGHQHTFSFREARVQVTREELERHGLGNFVTVYHSDVYQLDFSNDLEGKADAFYAFYRNSPNRN